MKKKTLLLAGILTCAITLSLTGCGSDKTAESADTESAQEETTDSETDTDADSTDAETDDTETDDTDSESADAEDTSELTDNEAILASWSDEVPLNEDADWKMDDCFELADYKGLKLTETVEPVTDEDVEEYLKNYLSAEEVTDPDATVQDGDTITLDYEGKKDGVAFDGGTATDATLVIGSGQFIDGFESGLIGTKVGETVDLNLTFPEDYSAEELAGQDVVFTCTVKSISRAPEITDEWVEESTDGEYTTVEDYYDFNRTTLEENNESEALYNLKSDAWEELMNTSTYKAYPKEFIEAALEEFDEEVTSEAESYGVDLQGYLDGYGMTAEDYLSRKEAYAVGIAQNRLLLDALADAEGLTTESDEYVEALETLTEGYQMDADTLIETYGEETVREYIMTSLLTDRILGYAEITKNTGEEE